ncbi:MAG: hypothetical protein U0L59_06370, partial [Faecalimonas sp.]|nr:hypothetical protein [Faecalimonas sp.]
MKQIKRLTALLLTLCLVCGVFPATAWAAGETTYVLAGSDFQAHDGHTAGAGYVSDILDKIKVDYSTMDGFLFAGDYDVNYTDSANGKATLQATVQGVYGTGMDEIYVQGNHDSDSLVGSTLTASGANDSANYGVFVINEKDYMWYNNDETTIKKTATNLETYLNAKRNAEYTKPIFVVSHLPLHYCMRTREGGNDGMHANYIFDVLNEAGAAGLNIIFMFGHNHSHGWDDYLGGASIFLKKGDKINIAQNSTTVFQEETLAFTYMNAGYVGYYGDSYTSTVDKTLTMTTFAITDTDVTISRYDSSGTHNLKSAGVYNVEYPDSAYYSTDTTTVGTPYTLRLNTEITPAGTEVEVPGTGTTTQRTYTRVTSTSELVSGGKYLIIENGNTDYFMLPESISNDAGDRVGYSIESTSVAGGDTITGDYYANEWTMTGSGNAWQLSTSAGDAYMEYQSSSRAYGRISASNSSIFTIGGSADAFTFTTTTNGYTYVLDHSSAGLINGYVKTADTVFYIYRLTDEGSSTPTVKTWGDKWTEIKEPVSGTEATPGTTSYKYVLDTDGVNTNTKYLIVNTSSNGTAYALTNNNGKVSATEVTIANGEIVVENDTNINWIFSGESSGAVVNQSRYVYPNDGSISLNSSGSNMTISHRGDGRYQIYRRRNVTSGAYYWIEFKSGWTGSRHSNQNKIASVYLFAYDSDIVTPGTEATPDTNGLYGKITGNLSYEVKIGTSADDALAAVKAGIDGYYYEGMSKPSPEVVGTIVDDSVLTWTLDSAYDGTTPGEYAVTIKYNGVEVGRAKVVVPGVSIKGYTVEPAKGTVSKGVSQTAETEALIYVQLEDGKYYTIPVTVAMLTKADGSGVSTGETGTFENLTLTYNGVVIANNFTLNVVAETGNNYPEYPDEGAVKVNKTATGIDFQSSGIAQVELSASGVSSKKGADVIVMLDLSSSMSEAVDGQTRLEVLKESLESLMTQLQANGEDGQPMDIRIAVADFHRYYTDSSSPYYINANDHLINGSIRTDGTDPNQVYTGTKALDAGAFVNVHSLKNNAFSGLSSKSGTNYDYAFDAIYQLGEAITTQNAAAGEERDLFVVFMSDGAPFQFNYFSAQSGRESQTTDARYWNDWLTGTLADDMKDANARNDYYNAEGKHWMAEAIKGDPAKTYPVIRKNNAADTDRDTWVNVNGLGATIYSVGFCLAKDKEITVNSMDTVIKNLASEEKYYFRADSATDLSSAFSSIGNDIAYAANNARFVDEMGDKFNLQLKTSEYTVVENGVKVQKTITPTIEVLTYDIYTRQDYLSGTITEDKIGDRKGTSTIIERVTFSADGKEAYSNLIDGGNKNILVNGVIKATTFTYNTNVSSVWIDADENSATGTDGKEYKLTSETFYWKMGTITTTELALRYYVYLEGSLEGTAAAGSYATNEYATIYYENYLGNDCKQDTVSPTIAWESANVSFAFYLVNEDGEIIVNQTTGEIGSFAHKIAITNPLVYKELLLNNTEQVSALNVKAISDDVLPEYYTLYDTSAVYEVRINSDSTGEWEITDGDPNDGVKSTYVTQYKIDDASAYSNDLKNNTVGDDYTHTIVWFAVIWSVQAHPDSVVIDYGLPVDISVLTNDMFGERGKLVGVGPYLDDLENTVIGATMQSGFGSTYTGTFGTATIDTTTGKVRYELDKSKGMQMQTYEKFGYAIYYSGNDNAGYYYDTVTVIPATTVYYEDDYVTLESFTWNNGWKEKSTSLWSKVGETVAGTQSEDRPGRYSLTDANNIYGYDSVNLNMSTYSMGSAMKATVDYDNMAQASFEFYGTGFDVISVTSADTGMIYVDIYDAGGTKLTDYCYIVDTYYGYIYENGEWVVDATSTDVLYQIPVVKIDGLTYGKYKAVIRAIWEPLYDHVEGSTNFDFYLDA